MGIPKTNSTPLSIIIRNGTISGSTTGFARATIACAEQIPSTSAIASLRWQARGRPKIMSPLRKCSFVPMTSLTLPHRRKCRLPEPRSSSPHVNVRRRRARFNALVDILHHIPTPEARPVLTIEQRQRGPVGIVFVPQGKGDTHRGLRGSRGLGEKEMRAAARLFFWGVDEVGFWRIRGLVLFTSPLN
jgi:hypothetical protein